MRKIIALGIAGIIVLTSIAPAFAAWVASTVEAFVVLDGEVVDGAKLSDYASFYGGSTVYEKTDEDGRSVELSDLKENIDEFMVQSELNKATAWEVGIEEKEVVTDEGTTSVPDVKDGYTFKGCTASTSKLSNFEDFENEMSVAEATTITTNRYVYFVFESNKTEQVAYKWVLNVSGSTTGSYNGSKVITEGDTEALAKAAAEEKAKEIGVALDSECKTESGDIEINGATYKGNIYTFTAKSEGETPTTTGYNWIIKDGDSIIASGTGTTEDDAATAAKTDATTTATKDGYKLSDTVTTQEGGVSATNKTLTGTVYVFTKVNEETDTKDDTKTDDTDDTKADPITDSTVTVIDLTNLTTGKYTVTFDPNGGVWDDESTDNKTVKTDNEATMLANISKDGYTLKYWINGTEAREPSEVVTVEGNVTYKAFWVSDTDKDYTLTVDYSGGTDDDGASSKSYKVATNQSWWYSLGQTVTIKGDDDTNYSLLGYYDKDGVKVYGADGVAAESKYWTNEGGTWKFLGTADLTVYAHWYGSIEAPTLTINDEEPEESEKKMRLGEPQTLTEDNTQNTSDGEATENEKVTDDNTEPVKADATSATKPSGNDNTANDVAANTYKGEVVDTGDKTPLVYGGILVLAVIGLAVAIKVKKNA